jgi:asparagine synthetase B (glutamine-hydrolysing)
LSCSDVRLPAKSKFIRFAPHKFPVNLSLPFNQRFSKSLCGIFGFAVKDRSQLDFELFKQDLTKLYKLSAKRGRDSAGLVTYAEQKYRIFQRAIDPLQFIDLPGFDQILKDTLDTVGGAGLFACINHCRLVTDGSASVADNNQPVYAGSFIGVHNGIITNAYAVQANPNQSRAANSESTSARNDTRVLFECLSAQYALSRMLATALAGMQANLEGSFSIAAFLDHRQELILATNTGSLYFALNVHKNILCFASESHFLKQFLASSQTFQPGTGAVQQVRARHYLRLSFDFELFEQAQIPILPKSATPQRLPATGRAQSPPFAVEFYRSSVQSLRRCTRCILPHTYPFVNFDRDGVCSFCRNHEPQKLKGEEALLRQLDRFRSKDGSPDCIVGLSGGRDSSYGLHILKTAYGMRPIAYTFDWGLTTDISRRNQAKVCGKLGIEHIIRSPDILMKRRFVRKNIPAWLKQPQLGMVPLFQAGDKEFYHFGRARKRNCSWA